VSFLSIRLKFSAEYTGSDPEISDAKNEETNFPAYAWVLLIASQLLIVMPKLLWYILTF